MSGSKIMARVTDLENAVFAQTAAMGALPTLYAATAPAVRGAQYFGPDQLFGMRGYPKQVRFVRAATSAAGGPTPVGDLRRAHWRPLRAAPLIA